MEVRFTSGTFAFFVVGVGDKAVAEGRERVIAASTGLGLAMPGKRIIANLAPADLPNVGSHYDLPIALADGAAMGELSLDGRIAPVAGALPAAVAAGGMGLGLICPEACAPEAAWAGETRILDAPSLIAVMNHFRGTRVISPPKPGPAPCRRSAPPREGGATLNAQAEGDRLETICDLDPPARTLVARAAEGGGLTARGCTRTLRLARTIADLEGSGGLRRVHVAEALIYRPVAPGSLTAPLGA